MPKYDYEIEQNDRPSVGEGVTYKGTVAATSARSAALVAYVDALVKPYAWLPGLSAHQYLNLAGEVDADGVAAAYEQALSDGAAPDEGSEEFRRDGGAVTLLLDNDEFVIRLLPHDPARPLAPQLVSVTLTLRVTQTDPDRLVSWEDLQDAAHQFARDAVQHALPATGPVAYEVI